MLQLKSGCGYFVAQDLPDENLFLFYCAGSPCRRPDLEFGCFIVRRLSAVARFRGLVVL